MLNFGQPAPIDIRISGSKDEEAYALALKVARDLNGVPGVVDSHVFQVPDAPALTVDVDRDLARELGLGQQSVASNMLVSLNNSLQVAPNFWLDPKNGVSYPLVVQMPTYDINSAQDLWTLPVTSPTAKDPQLLMNIAKFNRGKMPMIASQLNIRPVYDVHADVQGTDLNTAATGIEKVIAADQPDPAKSTTKITLSGQVETMQESFSGLFSGHGSRRRLRVPAAGNQLPKRHRFAYRAHGGSVRALRRDVDAVRHANAYQRAGPDGHAHVHRADHRQQHPGGDLLQPARGCRR